MQIDNSFFVASAAVLGTIGVFWQHVRTIFSYFISLFVVSVKICQPDAVQAFNCYCFNTMGKSPIGPKSYIASHYNVKKLNREQLVGFEFIDQTMFFWHGWRPLMITKIGGKESGNNTLPSSGFSICGDVEIKFIRGTFNSDRLLQDALDFYNKIAYPNDVNASTGQRYFTHHIIGSNKTDSKGAPSGPAPASPNPIILYRPIGYKAAELGKIRPPNAFSALVYKKKVMEAIRSATFWFKNRKWYQDRLIPWKIGWQLRGKPGTGKTSLARAVAQNFDIPIYIFDLSSLNNREFKDGWNVVRYNTPCMALFEDVDTVFDGRVNLYANSHQNDGCLSFDMLLNCMDGVEESDGIMIVITTNNGDKVDPAIGGGPNGGCPRPGRVDLIIELDDIDFDGAKHLCERILPEYPDVWDKIIKEGLDAKETPAQFQYRCRQFAIQKKYETEGLI